MLQVGVQARILSAVALESTSAVDLANKINTWIASSERAIIHDIQIIKTDNKLSAIIIFRA